MRRSNSGRLRLSHAVAEFRTRRLPKMAKNTAANYSVTLTGLQNAIREDVWLDNVTPRHLDRFVETYDHAPTANIKVSQLRRFFGWCVSQGYLKHNTAGLLETRKATRQGAVTKHRIPPSDWGRILDVAGDYHPLERIVVAMGLYLGQRSNELTKVKAADIMRGPDGVIEHLVITRSKVHEVLAVPVFAELADEIERWLAWYTPRCGDAFGNLPPNAYLLPARKSGQWTRRVDGRLGEIRRDAEVDPFSPISSPYKIIVEVLKRTGWYKPGEGAHTLRRSIAVALYEEDIERGYGEALETVKTLLGHASTTTTEVYLGTNIGRRRLDERVVRRHMLRSNEAADSGNVIPMEERRHG